MIESGKLKLGDVLEVFDQRLGVCPEPEILTLTEKMGFVAQRERFNKRLAIADTSNYKVIGLHDIAFNPYLLWKRYCPKHQMGKWYYFADLPNLSCSKRIQCTQKGQS
jgi:hypothetical protein